MNAFSKKRKADDDDDDDDDSDADTAEVNNIDLSEFNYKDMENLSVDDKEMEV